MKRHFSKLTPFQEALFRAHGIIRAYRDASDNGIATYRMTTKDRQSIESVRRRLILELNKVGLKVAYRRAHARDWKDVE